MRPVPIAAPLEVEGAVFTPTIEWLLSRKSDGQLLLDVGVEIVAGPSALGLYQLALIEGVSLNQAKAALESSSLIESLELPDT